MKTYQIIWKNRVKDNRNSIVAAKNIKQAVDFAERFFSKDFSFVEIQSIEKLNDVDIFYKDR